MNQVVSLTSSSQMSAPAATGSATGLGTSLSSKEAILALLRISTHLCDCSDHGLHISYQKYKAHLEATQAYKRMVADGSWTGNKLHAVELIELFASKSFWHSHVKRLDQGLPVASPRLI